MPATIDRVEQCHRPRARQPRTGCLAAFSLVELVVVMAMVAVLASLVLSVFAAAREHVYQVRCIAQTKQLADAFQIYANDWDMRLPAAWNPETLDGSHTWLGCGIYSTDCSPDNGVLFPYVRSKDVYLCPMEDGDTDSQGRPTKFSYSMNWMLNRYSLTRVGDPKTSLLLLHESPETRNDGAFGWTPEWTPSERPVHGSGTVTVYVDLHAEWVENDELQQAAANGDWNPKNRGKGKDKDKGTPPGHGGLPPGHGGTPPGLGGDLPPGQAD